MPTLQLRRLPLLERAFRQPVRGLRLPERALRLPERVLCTRPQLGASALLSFAVFALVSAVLPHDRVAWYLPSPLIWTSLLLVLVLLHAERAHMPRGAWLELWCAATSLAVLRVASLDWFLGPAIAAPDTAARIRVYVMWGCALALLGLLVLAAHRVLVLPWLVAAAGAVFILAVAVPQLAPFGLPVNLLSLESVFALALCGYTALLAVRHRRAPHAGVALPVAVWLTVLLLLAFLATSHPAAFNTYGVSALVTASLLPWGCLGLLTLAVLARARWLQLRDADQNEA
ncbi:hypothetical protein [Nocardiopsis oceani]